MRIVAVLVAAAIMLAAVFLYLQSSRRTIDQVRDTTSVHGEGRVEYSREAVNKTNRATRETRERLEQVTGR
ncbi:MAG: hypothetical protein GF418_02035 [Chitinivibrionales bacterium]|nr:hypothetical protein [Chitinivibrionales bacterium]MBD3394380.1 hypothetical protein [Chitinivibrionales bacterium]